MKTLATVAAVFATAAAAQPFSTQPVGTGTVQTVIPQTLALTPAGRSFYEQQLSTYLARRTAALPSRSAALASGLSTENDAVEHAWLEGGRWVLPHHVAKAVVAPAPVVTVDPAALEGARAAARVKKGRAPTAAEVNVELAAFDARIAALNASLAAQRPAIAAAYAATGHAPRDLEAGLLGVTPREPQMVSPNAVNATHLRNAFTRYVNAMAAAQPPTLPSLDAGVGPVLTLPRP
ncbi:MAG: hypothetical protein JNK82_35820 [Myxococcaceae bacterium]|nr:hypothetical protein [Myxococcaceae bacterium]